MVGRARTPLVPLLGAAAVLLVGALGPRVADGFPSAAVLHWGLAATGLLAVARTARIVLRGHFAADIVAALAIVSAFVLGFDVAGLVVVLMQSGGEALERYAEGRASRAVQALEAAAPRIAHRLDGEHAVEIPVDAIRIGDRLLVRPGELVPCDGVVRDGRSHVDTATLTGEPVPRLAAAGSVLASGMLNLEGPLVLEATALAAQSRYARIVDLVRTAQASKAPFQRLADRYAIWFTPITLAVCAVAWGVSGDPARALAVLVVATPCPLILAVPVAVVGGINRAARRAIVIRNGTALEELERTTVVAFDKTGTVTIGRPRVARIIPLGGLDEATLLARAAAVEFGSGHLLARTLVEAARERGVAIPEAQDVVETAGAGVTGRVGGRAVSVGALQYTTARHPGSAAAFAAAADRGDGLRAWVAIDCAAAGIVEYADALREGLGDLGPALRAEGVTRFLLLSGDAQDNLAAAAAHLGFDEARGNLLPDQKAAIVRALRAQGDHVAMLGDGTNDAPALAEATVGIALAAGGSGISAEAADVIFLADDPRRLLDAIAISRRTMRIARQSIWGGLGLSAVAMVVAATGHLAPTAGALLQEAIDVAVILNALRAAR